MAELDVQLIPDLEEQLDKMVGNSSSPEDVAKQILNVARGMAPVGETGLYRAGLEVQKTPRGARVVATDQKSAWIEFGVPNRDIPGRWILRNAASSLGFTFKSRNKKGS